MDLKPIRIEEAQSNKLPNLVEFTRDIQRLFFDSRLDSLIQAKPKFAFLRNVYANNRKESK